ncbi:hypothetical protein PTSG_11664 [Salpingoeca rosetta]|uniref:EGF-like domain-containing protein n=1 Tax=Salpingoeca rosetta (strain ATCC 50818 / BSB-021) TaxID=946362 RepID=F2TXY9_SALR5|nr:uncharacterized protein PTSG_11664 [Salpingoeca rosetta]EGD76248.1 hypothetical protein PTSG_11664 [Salpingoeca rosetta]|eukprot:XP_004998423.1 hypothetical protein PTSG_11664 [Salpingoeca rosetta]
MSMARRFVAAAAVVLVLMHTAAPARGILPPPWAGWFSKPLDRFAMHCPKGASLSMLRSQYDPDYHPDGIPLWVPNLVKARRWDFWCTWVSTGSTHYTRFPADLLTIIDRWDWMYYAYGYPSIQWSDILAGEGNTIFACPDNQYVAGVKRLFDDAEVANSIDPNVYSTPVRRYWQLLCEPIENAKLTDCRSDIVFANDYEEELLYAFTERVLTGWRSEYDADLLDSKFKFITCKVECDRDSGFKPMNERECEYVTCPYITLEHGSHTGYQGGAIGVDFTYESCDEGYELSTTGDKTRTCGWLGDELVWSGTPKTCDDIDECATGAHNCDGPSAICINTPGSFSCSCIYGTLVDGQCVVPAPSVSMSVGVASLSFTLSGQWTTEFPNYQVSIGRWAYDLSAHTDINGYPQVVSKPFTSHAVSNLAHGTRYRVTLTPLDEYDQPQPHFEHVAYHTGTTDPQTPCGCQGLSDAPVDFNMEQFNGHITFEWRDRSMCESAFTFTRNGVGLASRFESTAEDLCDAAYKPLSLFDDLTIQSSGSFAELDSSINYKLPEGSFYLRLSTAVDEGDMRLMYPHELQRQKTHFASTSTTTTAAPLGVPKDEHRYYPGTSSPVASVTECKDLCDIRSSWCIAFVVQTKTDDTLVCHQLRVVQTAALKSGEKKAVSYERVTVSGTGVSGSYIFDGTQDDCEQACIDSGSCVLTMVDEGVCGVINSAVTTGTPATATHASFQPDFSRFIPGPEAGSTQRYCVAATNPTWYTEGGYSSQLACKDFEVMWESYLEGQVTIDSKEIHLPVEHVEIEYEIGPIRGRRVTNEDGKFFIHILSDQLRGNRNRMTLRFSKTTGNIRHTFSCGGIACTETTLIMEHLRFDHHASVSDTTSLPFSGIVSIGGTEHEGLPDGCPLKDVEVCLYDINQANTLINCDVTDSKGRYLIRAVMGTSVTVGLTYGNSSHTYERAPYARDAANAPSGLHQVIDATNTMVRTPYYDVTDGKFWENINFKDTTTDKGTIDIAGGLCNLNLGDAVMEFRYDACPTWVKTHTVSDRLSEWTLPAQIITVRFKEITRNYEVRGEITRYFSAKLGNSRSLYLDLRNPQEDDEDKKTVRFEYHPPPQLSVEFDKEVKHNCNSTEGDRPLHVVKQNVELKATVKVIEDYGEGVGTCDAVPGQIEVENQLGESPAIVDVLNATTPLSDDQLNKLKRCYDTCIRDVKMDEELEDGETVYSNTRIELSIMTGEPETNPQAIDPENPHSKLFRVTMHNLPHNPVSVYEKVVVIGDKVISKYFSVPFPRYRPLAVVQDPPGGLSTVTYSKAYANFYVDTYTHEVYNGFYTSLGVAPVKAGAETQTCGGFGAMLCVKSSDVDTTPVFIRTDLAMDWASADPEDNYMTGQTMAFEISLTTSDDVMTAGEKSDMFLVPALNVVWLETEEVSFDVEQCQASKQTKVKWSLEGQDNTEVLSWVSAFEIENKEIPDLRKLLALAEQPPGDDDDETEEDREEKAAELRRAIKAWEDNLARNKEVRQQAADGTLESVQALMSNTFFNEYHCTPEIPDMSQHPWTDRRSAEELKRAASKEERCNFLGTSHIENDVGLGAALAPHDLIDNARDVDGQAASDADKTQLRSINAIKFSGGGSTYTFGVDISKSTSVVAGDTNTVEATLGVETSFEFKVFGIGASFEGALGYHHDQTNDEEHEAGVDTETHIEVTLGDPDPFDVFDVKMYLHPDYGTLVFHTTSGQSSCPHEPNTVQLEQPGVSILKRPEAPVLPGEPAVFELLLKNDGPMTSDFNLFYLSWLNQDGLEVVANGQALETPLVFEGFPANSASHIVITVNQGPNKFKYDPVAIGWRSLCEADRHPDNGYITDEVTSVEYVYLEAEFLQPCSPVKLVGEIGESGAFTLNQETMEQDYKPGQIRVVAFNSDHAERTWLEDDRLEKVVIEYKPANSYVWLLARDENGDALDIRERENEYGYITSWWDASTLLEGDYHLRIRAQCQASINEMPDGIDEQVSSIALGVVDRSPPVVFGFPEPADGEFFPGDEMSFQFNEDVECRQPFIFQVSLTVEDYDRDFNNNNMVIVCEGRKISMSLRRRFRYDEVNGLTATVVIENVKDLNDNLMEFPPEHTFQFAELNLADASVTLNGLVLAAPYQDVYADTTSQEYADFAGVLKTELATIVDTDPSRVTITGISPVDATNFEAGITVSLRFTPEGTDTAATGRRRRATTSTATDLASLLQSRLQDAAYTESLSVLNTASLDEEATVDVEPSTADLAQNDAVSADTQTSGAGAAGASDTSTSASTGSSASGTDSWANIKLDIAIGMLAVVLCMLVILLVRGQSKAAASSPKRMSSMFPLRLSPFARTSSRVSPFADTDTCETSNA